MGYPEMASNTTGSRRQHTENQWRSLLARFEASGLAAPEFCRQEAISAASLYRWRSRLRNGTASRKAAGDDLAAAFVDLGTLDSVSPPKPRLDLKLDLGDGLTLHLVRS